MQINHLIIVTAWTLDQFFSCEPGADWITFNCQATPTTREAPTLVSARRACTQIQSTPCTWREWGFFQPLWELQQNNTGNRLEQTNSYFFTNQHGKYLQESSIPFWGSSFVQLPNLDFFTSLSAAMQNRGSGTVDSFWPETPLPGIVNARRHHRILRRHKLKHF